MADHILREHIFFEFAGMPKSGKTTALDIVSHYLRRQGVPTGEYHGGGRYAAVSKRDLGALNLFLACEAVRYCLAAAEAGLPPRIHLLDRGLVDRLIFTRALHSEGRVSDAHRHGIEAILGFPEMSERIDTCFVFSTSASLSLERESKFKLTDESGRVMNMSLLEQLGHSAREIANSDGISCVGNVVHIDTEERDGSVTQTAADIANLIAERLGERGFPLPPALTGGKV